MKAILRRALRRAFLRLPRQETIYPTYSYLYWLFLGNDVFISYGRGHAADAPDSEDREPGGSAYSEALEHQLARAGIVCYSDRRGAPPGKEIPVEVLCQLVHSSVLVVVASPEAAASKNVELEVCLFSKRNRPIIPIDFEGVLPTARWFELVEGIDPEEEPQSSLKKYPPPVPKEEVVRRIVNVEESVSRRRRLREIYLYTAGGILSLLLVGALVALLIVGRAQAETSRQKDIAKAHSLVGEAEDLLIRQPDRIDESVRKAASALHRFNRLGIVVVEADRALRRGLEFLRPCITEIPRSQPVAAVALNSDGRLLALGGAGSIEVWKLVPSSRRGRCPPESASQTSFSLRVLGRPKLMFLKDGRLAVVERGLLRICAIGERPETDCESVPFETRDTLTAMDASGQIFAIIDRGSRTVRVRNLGSDQETSFPLPQVVEKDIDQLAISSNGAALAMAKSQKRGSTIHIIRMPAGVLKDSFPTPSFVDSLAFSRDGLFLAASVGRQPPEVTVWDLASRHPTSLPQAHGPTLSFSPDGRALAVGGASAVVSLWDRYTRREIARLPQTDRVQDAAYSADGKRLAITSGFEAQDSVRLVRVWDTEVDLADVPLVAVRKPPVTAMPILGPDGRKFAVSPEGFEVREVDATTASWRTRRYADRSPPGGRGAPEPEISLSPGDAYLAAAALDGTVRAWALPRAHGSSPTLLRLEGSDERDEPPYLLTWSPDERFLAVLRLSRRATVWDVQGGRRLRCFQGVDSIRSFQFSRDSRLAIVALQVSGGGELRACELENASELKIALTGAPMGRALALHPDGRHVAIGLVDSSVEVWDLKKRAQVAHLGLAAGSLADFAFGSDPRYLVAENSQGATRTWLWHPQDLVEEAFRRLGEEPPQDLPGKPTAASH